MLRRLLNLSGGSILNDKTIVYKIALLDRAYRDLDSIDEENKLVIIVTIRYSSSQF